MQHRQTIQYIQPHKHGKLSQIELSVIDEATTIPLPVVKPLLGSYLVSLSSTINSYEGNDWSLSLKLPQQLEEQSQMPTKTPIQYPFQVSSKVKSCNKICFKNSPHQGGESLFIPISFIPVTYYVSI